MTTPAMFLVPARVVVGTKTIFQRAKLFEEAATIKTIVDGLLHDAAERAAGSIIFESVEACASEEALERGGTELASEDLPRMTVGQLRGCFGGFIKVHVSRCGETSGAPRSLPSASKMLMETQKQQSRALPTPPDGAR